MTFNEQNTIENAIRDHLVGTPVSTANETIEDETSEYKPSSGLQWQYIRGERLALHGKQPQDVFVDIWLKEAICRLNKPIASQPDLADEIIHRLRGVLLEANYSGL